MKPVDTKTFNKVLREQAVSPIFAMPICNLLLAEICGFI